MDFSAVQQDKVQVHIVSILNMYKHFYKYYIPFNLFIRESGLKLNIYRKVFIGLYYK